MGSPFLLDYNRIIFLFIVTLDDSIDLTRNSPAFGCTKHTHTIIIIIVVVVIVVVVETVRSSSSSFVADSVAKQQIRDKMAASSVGCRSDIGGGGLMRQQRVFLIGCLLFSKKMKVVCGRFLLL